MTARSLAQKAQEIFFARVFEADLDTCLNTYGVTPCTAGRKATGTAQAGTSTTITLAAGTAIDPTTMIVRLTGGTGSGQERQVISWNSGSKVATVSPNWTTNPDATSTYDVIDRPNACRNTFGTCQDKPNYNRGTKTRKFCSRGMRLPPGELIRPYLASVDVADTEWVVGLARRARVTLTLVDAIDDDRDEDPYWATRPAPADGSYWPRLLARNPHYGGRFGRMRNGYVVNPWDWNTFQTELYVFESIKDSGSGTVTITLLDPLKLADRTLAPIATDGELTGNITAVATTIPLGTGKGAQYDIYGYPTWVQLDDETIKIASRTGDTLNVDTGGRGAFGTVAATHNQNAKAQVCLVFISVPLTDVLKKFLNLAGITNTYIDTTQFADEESRWLGSKYWITTCLADPEVISTLIHELVTEANAGTWWDLVTSKVKFKVDMPQSVGANIPLLTDEASFKRGSARLEMLESERITRCALDYSRKTPIAPLDQAESFGRGNAFIDNDAEGPNEYNGIRPRLIRSRFLSDQNSAAVSAFVSRDVSARRDTPGKFKFRIHPKDYDFGVGDLRDIESRAILDAAGRKKTTRVRITRVRDKGADIECEARTTKFRNRYAYIAPNGTPNYPTDQVYAHICVTATGKMTNGDDPYLII